MDEQLKAFTEIVQILAPLERDEQTRIVAAVCLLLDIPRVKSTIASE
jgi:hypothetical protein